VLEAMTGRFDAARSHLEEARLGRSEFSDRGTIVTSWTALAGEVELLAGNPARSEQLLAASCAVLRAGGDPEWLATNTAFLAEAVYEQERNAEALALSAESLSIAPKGHLTSRAVALRVQARALARAGRTREARALAAEMIELLEATDALNERAAAFAAAAEVHALAGDAAPAEESWQKAIELFEQKGNVVLAERARRSRAALQIATGSP